MKQFKKIRIISCVGLVIILITLVVLTGFGRKRMKYLRLLKKGFWKNGKIPSKHCQNFKLKERINPSYFYYYNGTKVHRGFLWCKIPKAASTTLTKFLLRLVGGKFLENDSSDTHVLLGNSTSKLHRALRDYFPKISLQKLQELSNSATVKVMVVRDPFERLVSAYRDKLQDYYRDLRFRDGYYYENYGQYMVPKEKTMNNITKRVPTWPEFITYLLRTSISRYDEHWMPMSRLCSPCSMEYDYVIKLEHFDYQFQHPLKRLGLNEWNIGWSHQTGSGNPRIINKYFNNLTLSDIKRLYIKYKRDFQLFGYKAYKYFKLANK